MPALATFDITALKAGKPAKSTNDELLDPEATEAPEDLSDAFLSHGLPVAPELSNPGSRGQSLAEVIVELAKEIAARAYGPTPSEQRILDDAGWPTDWRNTGWQSLLNRLDAISETRARMAELRALSEPSDKEKAELNRLEKAMVVFAPAEVIRQVRANGSRLRRGPYGAAKALGIRIVERRAFVGKMSDPREAESYFGPNLKTSPFFERYPNTLTEDQIQQAKDQQSWLRGTARRHSPQRDSATRSRVPQALAPSPARRRCLLATDDPVDRNGHAVDQPRLAAVAGRAFGEMAPDRQRLRRGDRPPRGAFGSSPASSRGVRVPLDRRYFVRTRCHNAEIGRPPCGSPLEPFDEGTLSQKHSFSR